MSTFVGIGLGPIQTGIFLAGAFKGGFDRIVIAEVNPDLKAAVNAAGSVTVNIANRDSITTEVYGNVEVYNPLDPAELPKLIEAAAEAEEFATALPSVKFFSSCAPWLLEGFKRSPERRRFIYTAENNNHAAEELEKAVGVAFPNTYYLNTVIGKMSGVLKESPLPMLAPGAPVGVDPYSQEWNIISYLDRLVYPNHILIKNGYEPESLFSVANAAALALIGMCLGSLLKTECFSKAKKSAMLVMWTLLLLGLGAFFHLALGDQIVKKLWTTSFIFYAAAYSSAMLALFYWVIDVKGFRFLAYPFMVVGVNSITIYLFMMLGVQRLLAAFLFNGVSKWLGDPWGPVAMNFGSLLTGWFFVYFLYRRKIFLKV